MQTSATDKTTFVSLNPCTDAILAEVAEPEQVLAISHYSHDPAASSMEVELARSFPATGGTVEEILALQPDIVLASDFIAPSTRQALERLGVRVETFGIAATPEASIEQVHRIAQIAGTSEQGEALASRISGAVSAAQPTSKDERLQAVLWQPSGIVPGEGALVSALMRIAGFDSHSAAIGMGQADYLSLEAMLANPPDVLLVAGQERSQSHPVLAELDGKHIAPFDASLLYCGGPTIIRALERLEEIRGQAA